MARVQRLEEIGGLAAPDLADDDVVGPVAQRVPHQVADRDGGLGADSPGLEPQAVGPVDPELERVLDGDDPLLLGEQLDQGIQQRGLPRSGASRDQDVPPGGQHLPGGAEHRLGEGPLADEVVGREHAAPEPADRHSHVGARGRSAYGDPRAVLEPRIENGPGRGIEPERAGYVDGRPVERSGGELRRVERLELPTPLDPDVPRAVDHELGDLRILEHGLEPRQERLQMPDPARPLHIRPSSRSRQ